MPQNPESELEAKWFKKLNSPDSGTYRLAHARRGRDPECSEPFDPGVVAKQVKAAVKQHLADHIAVMTK